MDSKTGAVLGKEPRKVWELISIAPGTGLRAECYCSVCIAAHALVVFETMGTLTPVFSLLEEYIAPFWG